MKNGLFFWGGERTTTPQNQKKCSKENINVMKKKYRLCTVEYLLFYHFKMLGTKANWFETKIAKPWRTFRKNYRNGFKLVKIIVKNSCYWFSKLTGNHMKLF